MISITDRFIEIEPGIQSRLARVLSSHYSITTVKVMRITGGISNSTFYVTADDGARYVLQSLHAIFTDELIESSRKITMFLTRAGWNVPVYILTRDGAVVAKVDSERYRVYRYIDGMSIEGAKIVNVEMARESGALLRKLHDDFRACAVPLPHSLKHFHDISYFMAALESELPHMPEKCRALAERVLATYRTLKHISLNYTQIIHGDVRIENFLFTLKLAPITIIDFDTVMYGSPLLDVGDLLRSLSVTDEQTKPFVRGHIIQAAISGYWGDESIRGTEMCARAIEAAQQLCLELSSRFLIDVVRDEYFAWNSTRFASRQEANAARAQGQWDAYEALARMV